MYLVRVCLLAAFAAPGPSQTDIPEQESVLPWKRLEAGSEPGELNGTFVGVSGRALIIAGGMRQTTGNARGDSADTEYSDRVYVLHERTGDWVAAEQRLPQPAAYGVSATWEHGRENSLVCLGGGNAEGHLADAVIVQLVEGRVQITRLPRLPSTVKYACGAVLDDTVYVSGGLEKPDSTEALHKFWSLDLATLDAGTAWQTLDPWPGPSRMLPVAGAQTDSIFVFGGIHISRDGDGGTGNEQYTYLQDAYRYTPEKPPRERWQSCTDIPYPLAASPSPAVALGQSHLMLLGNDLGPLDLGDRRTPAVDSGGFVPQILAYHTITDTWIRSGELTGPGIETSPRSAEAPRAPTATVTTRWDEAVVVPMGAASQILWANPVNKTSGLGRLDFVVIGGYFVVLIGMGIYFSRRENTMEEFFLAGKRVPWWAAGISIFGTVLSPISFMAIPALIYGTDWVFMPGALIGIAVAPAVIRFYLPFFRRLNVTTAYEYLEKRFNYPTRALASTVFILSNFIRMGVVLYLPSLALATVTGLDIYACIFVLGVTATFYTVLGGIEAVVWTDVMQVLILLGGVAYCLCVIFASVPGGMPAVLHLAYDHGKLHAINWTGGITTTLIWVVVGGRYINYLVAYSADQTIIQRYLTTADEKMAARAIWINALMTIPSVILFFGSGTALWAFYRYRPELLNPAGMTDQIFPWFIAGQLPAGLAGLVIAALFAACMSSLDSSMNSITAVFTTDFYRRFRPQVSDSHCLRVARWLTLLVGAVGTGTALAVAWLESPSIWEENLKILGLFMGGLGGIFAAGIFTRRINGPGVIIGFAASVALTAWVSTSALVHFFLFVVVGFFGCPIVGWLVSWVIPWGRKDTTGLTVFSLPPSEG